MGVEGALNAMSSEDRQNAVRAYVDYRGTDDTAAAANTQSQHAPEDDSNSVFLLWLAILGLTALGATLAITALVCSIKFRQKEKELQKLRANMQAQQTLPSSSFCCSTPHKCLCAPPKCMCTFHESVGCIRVTVPIILVRSRLCKNNL